MNFRYKNSLYSIWIHGSDFINMNSWYDFITGNQWGFNILNHNIEFSSELWIHSNEFKQNITQNSVMNSYMKWILMNSQILFHGWIYGFI